jgi:hypothetical protein
MQALLFAVPGIGVAAAVVWAINLAQSALANIPTL